MRIDNPVTHLGLEAADVFLQKQRAAINNLARLRRDYPNLSTRLTELADRFPLLPALARAIPERRLIKYLTTRQEPDLRALDILKLRWYGTAT